jgi:hypothetical protein
MGLGLDFRKSGGPPSDAGKPLQMCNFCRYMLN